MRARSAIATALVVVACVLAPLAVSAVWVDRTIYDTDGYVATVSPLARKAAIERALVNRTVAVIDDELERRLDPDPDAGPVRRRLDEAALAAGHRAAEQAANRVVQSDQFQQLWDRLNREGHAEALTWFSGESSRVRAGVDDDKLVISLQPLVEEVAERVEGLGVADLRLSGDRIRRLDPEIVLVDGPLVEPIQRTLRTLDALALPLSLLTLVAAIGALALATDRRRALARLGIGVTIGMAVVLVALRVGREEFLRWIDTTSVSVPASTAFFDTVVRDLRDALLIGLVLGLGIALAARFAGGRRTTTTEPPDSVVEFVAEHVAGASLVVVLVGLAALALIPGPTMVTALVVGVVVLAVVGAMWIAAARVRASRSDPTSSTG